MEAIEAVYNLMLSMFICWLFLLVFLGVLFLAQGVVSGIRWLYHRYQWVRWFNRQY